MQQAPIRFLNSKGTKCSLVPPTNEPARQYLARQNFWQRFNFSPEVVEQESLRRITTSTSLNDIVDIERADWVAEDVAETVQTILRRTLPKRASPIGEIVAELVDNFAQHAKTTLAAFTMQYYPNLHQVTIAIGDCGIGIRESLSANSTYQYLRDRKHCDAALLAFDPLVSCRAEGGTGLTEVRDRTLELGGRLIFTTGDGYVMIEERSVKVGDMAFDLPGVQIELRIPEEG